MSLSAESRRMELLLSRFPKDGLLERLLALGDGFQFEDDTSFQMGFGIVLIVGGLVIRGEVTRTEEFARRLDTKFLDGMQQAAVVSNGSPLEGEDRQRWQSSLREALAPALLAEFVGIVRTAQKEGRAKIGEFEERVGDTSNLSIDDLPDEVVAAYIADMAGHPFVCLKNSAIMSGSSWVDIGDVRIRVESISGWSLV